MNQGELSTRIATLTIKLRYRKKEVFLPVHLYWHQCIFLGCVFLSSLVLGEHEVTAPGQKNMLDFSNDSLRINIHFLKIQVILSVLPFSPDLE